MKTIKIKYKQKLLELVEKELHRQEQRLNSAEVKIRQLQDEQKALLHDLCQLESSD